MDMRSTSGYCVLLGGNLVAWKSNKQHIVSQSRIEAKYRAMAHVTSELLWLRMLLLEIETSPSNPSALYCDNQYAILLHLILSSASKLSILRLIVILCEKKIQ